MDPVLYRTFRNADLLLPDGIGIVAAVRLLYGLRLQRVPGSEEFIFDICRLCARRGDGVFVYGAKEEVNRAAVEILAKRFDGLSIVGRSNGYVAEADMPALVDKINASGARVIFLALGSPMQERWLAKYSRQAGERARLPGGGRDAGHHCRDRETGARVLVPNEPGVVLPARQPTEPHQVPASAAGVCLAGGQEGGFGERKRTEVGTAR